MFRVDPIAQETSYPQILCIQHLLEAQAERTPDAVAIAAPGRRALSYLRLLGHVNEVVPRLNSLGVGRQDCVALVLPNGPEMAVAFLAVAAAAICAPLNPSYGANEFASYLSDLKAKALIVQPGIDSLALGVARDRGIPVIQLSPLSDAEAGLFTITGRKRPRPFLQGFAHRDDVALALHTSGTTSRPKVVPLTQANICTSAYNVGGNLQLNKADRCLNVMPLFHIHGLIGALLSSLTAGASVVCSPGLYSPNFFEWVREFSPTWYTASPTIHQAILARVTANGDIIARHPLRFIRSSSAPLPRPVRTELEKIFHTPVIESYGMTEASHQIASNPLPPGQRKTGSVGLAAGPEIAIMDERGGMLSNGTRGEIVIRGANVMLGYEHNQEANNRAFSNGWFRTGDEGFFDDDGYLFITGRLKEMINCGGEKIAPCEIDEVLMSHPAVAQAITFSLPHSFLGEKVAAAIVLRTNATATAREIQAFTANRMIQFKVPHPLVIVDEIPKGLTGKLQRKGLAEKLGLTASNETAQEVKAGYTAPRTSLEMQLTRIWAETLGLERVGIHDNFFDLGGYSLLAVYLFEKIHEITGKHLPVTALFQAPTIERLANILCQDGWSAPWSSLVGIQPNGSKPPFFCVHPCGGNVLWYYDLARHLGRDQPFYALQAQGLDGKQPLHSRVEEMAAHYVKEISTLQSGGPYFLGGLHFGGLVAFEMAQQLSAQGHEVSLVVLLETQGPDYPNFLPNDLSFRRRVDRVVRRNLHALKRLGQRERLIYVGERVKTLSRSIVKTAEVHIKKTIWKVGYRLDRSIGRPLPRVLDNLPEIHRQAAREYVPKPYLGRMALFRAKEQPIGIYPDPTMGFGELAAAALEIHEVPGKHSTIIREPLVRVLAEQIAACIQKHRLAA